MSLRINHNIAAMNGQNNLAKNDMMVSKSLERLSSGLRINRAADDAAGLVISEQMRAQLSGLGQAINNSETAVNMVQTAEGALDEISTLLLKGRELAVHAANEGANDVNQLTADQSELDNIIDSVNRIAGNTQFGTKKLLDGTLSQAKSNDAAIGSVKLGQLYTVGLASGGYHKGYDSIQVNTVATKATLVISGLDDDVAGGTGATDLATMSGTTQFEKSFSISVMGNTVNVVSGSTKKNLFDQLNAIGKTLGFIASTTGSTSGLEGDITLTAKNVGGSTTFDFQFVGGATGAASIAGAYTSGVD